MGNDQFAIWLDGAPVVQPGGNDTVISVTGEECITETGDITVNADAVVTVTGEECLTETGTVTIVGSVPVFGINLQCNTETGTVTATGGALCTVTGEECETETGDVIAGEAEKVDVIGEEISTETGTVTITNQQLGFAGVADTKHRSRQVYKFPKSEKPRKPRYKRRKTVESETVLEVEPVIEEILPVFQPSITIARVHGSECSVKTGISNVKVDYPDDQEVIELILEVLNSQELEDDELDQDDLEVILTALEQV